LDSDFWIELARSACKDASLKTSDIKTIATWDQKYCANAVYQVNGGQYLKLFGPNAERQFHIERSVLRTLETQTAIPAPSILAERERSPEPSYLILSGIGGDTAEDVWDDLERSQQLALSRRFGEITATIHRLPQGHLAAVERQFGGRNEHTQTWKMQRMAEIEMTERLSLKQRQALLQFLQVEAPQHFDNQPRLTHYDLAHNHIYLLQDMGKWEVTGIIDWAEAMLGPPEWDVVYLWFWTFTRDRDAMRECLQTLYANGLSPKRLARRCMAAVLYTSSMSLLWHYFAESEGSNEGESIVREMTTFYFPPDVFGHPD
jgi:aminoglycoside phosphotransferase (APT) family kinase protein